MAIPSLGADCVVCLKEASSSSSSSSSPPLLLGIHNRRRLGNTKNRRRCRRTTTIQYWTVFHANILQRLHVIFLLCFLFLGPSSTNRTSFFVTAQTDLSCDIPADTTCPNQNNGLCESNANTGFIPTPGCETGDCFDCNILCKAFAQDCESCLDNGCYWCPGDATCYNSDLYLFPDSIASCTTEDDYFKDVGPEVCSTQGAPFSDPLYAAQEWVFDMINIQPVWETKQLFGTGIRMRINDSGMNHLHPEFDGRFDVSASCDDFEPRDGHGTAVAAIAAASGNNGECSVGVAPAVTLSACYALEGAAWIADDKFTLIDIAQNSIGVSGCIVPSRKRRLRRLLENESEDGNDEDYLQRQLQSCPFSSNLNSFLTFPCDVCDFSTGNDADLIQSTECVESIRAYCGTFFEVEGAACTDLLGIYVENQECIYNSLSTEELDGFLRGTTEGRDGKGIIYVFASGNDFGGGDDVNFSQMQNTRFTISVGSVGKDESHASYSNPGAPLLVCAPGGDSESINNFASASVEFGCEDAGKGTSFACPVVSGVVALMLQANSELSWRDVQGVLATTSRMVTNDPDDNTRITNGAGLIHSNFYGFGIVDANSAVTAAQSWELYGPELQLTADSGLINLAISDTSANVLSTVSITNTNTTLGAGEFVTESVEIILNLRHFSRGDLDIILTSPSGTTSVMVPGKRPENTQLDIDQRWQLVTVRNWNEDPLGDWTLQISDVKSGDSSVCVDRLWHLVVSDFRADCLAFEGLGWCKAGEVDEAALGQNVFILDLTDDEGLTATDACCACGGGRTRADADFVDELVDWQLVVYGHALREAETTSPKPSSQSSSQPSSQPSPALRGAPTGLPSQSPTGDPNATQSQPPTALTNSTLNSSPPSNAPPTASSISPSTGNGTATPTSSLSPSQKIISSPRPSSSDLPTTANTPTQAPNLIYWTRSPDAPPVIQRQPVPAPPWYPQTPTIPSPVAIPPSPIAARPPVRGRPPAIERQPIQPPSTVPSISPSTGDGAVTPTSSLNPSRMPTDVPSALVKPSIFSATPGDRTVIPTATLSPSQKIVSSAMPSSTDLPNTTPTPTPATNLIDWTRSPNAPPIIQRQPIQPPPWYATNQAPPPSPPIPISAQLPGWVTAPVIERQSIQPEPTPVVGQPPSGLTSTSRAQRRRKRRRRRRRRRRRTILGGVRRQFAP